MSNAALASDCVGVVLCATATVTAPARKLKTATSGTIRRRTRHLPSAGVIRYRSADRAVFAPVGRLVRLRHRAPAAHDSAAEYGQRPDRQQHDLARFGHGR